jgi:hypothetical protein
MNHATLLVTEGRTTSTDLLFAVNDEQGVLGKSRLSTLKVNIEGEQALGRLHASMVECVVTYREVALSLSSKTNEVSTTMAALSRYRTLAQVAWVEYCHEKEKCRIAILFLRFHWWHQMVEKYRKELRIDKRRKQYIDAMTDATFNVVKRRTSAKRSRDSMSSNPSGRGVSSSSLIVAQRSIHLHHQLKRRRSNARARSSHYHQHRRSLWDGEDWNALSVETASREVAASWWQWEQELSQWVVSQQREANRAAQGELPPEEILAGDLVKEELFAKPVGGMTCDWKWLLYCDGPTPSDVNNPTASVHHTTQIHWITKWLIQVFSKGTVAQDAKENMNAKVNEKEKVKEKPAETVVKMLSFYRAQVLSNSSSLAEEREKKHDNDGNKDATVAHQYGLSKQHHQQLHDFMDDDGDDVIRNKFEKQSYPLPVVRVCCRAILDKSLQQRNLGTEPEETKRKTTTLTHDVSTGVHGMVIFRVLGHGNHFSSSMESMLHTIPPNTFLPLIVISLLPHHETATGMQGSKETQPLSINTYKVSVPKQQQQENMNELRSSLQGVLPKFAFEKGRLSTITEFRLNGIPALTSPRMMVSFYCVIIDCNS